jgi:hypothetical protein
MGFERAGSREHHLVNLTNPMMMKGPIRALYPVGPQQVSIRLPSDHVVREVRLLVSKSDPQMRNADGVVSLTVPSILDHEVIAIVSKES